MSQHYHAVGSKAWRKDGIAKVTGAERYTSDIVVPRMWYGRVLRSPHAHAKIIRLDTSAAEALGAVCLTFDDIPVVRYNERLVSIPAKLYKDRFVLANKARHVGEALAAVAAPSEELAEKALRALAPEYEVLPPVLDLYAAQESTSAQLYDSIIVGREVVPIHNNVACERTIAVGEIEEAWAEADLVLEQEFRTSANYHAQLETKGALVEPNPDGSITVWATAQSIHNVRILLGQIFDLPLHKVNVKRLPIGGTFGSSIQTNTVIPICTALALKARRPVQILQTREEDWHDHTNYPSIIQLKLGVTRDGQLTGGKMKLLVDIGAHNTQAFPYVSAAAGWWVSLYRLPRIQYEGVAVYTNKVPTCALRGFGAPQVHFAVESMMDLIAERLAIDPIELRMRNYVGLGDTFWGQGPSVKSVVKSDGVPGLLRHGAEVVGWRARPKAGEQGGRYRRGLGMARGLHTSGTGAPRPGEVIDFSSATVKINEDGSVDLTTSLMDHGGGSLEAAAKIVAETLGVPLTQVGISDSDTRTTAYDVATHATRGVYVGGGAAHKAALQLREQLLQLAGQLLDVNASALSIRPDEASNQGIIYCDALPGHEMTVADVAAWARANSWGTLQAAESYRPTSCPPAYVVHFVEVEVDTETGVVRPVRAVIGSDSGTIVNPDMAVGQLEGGLLQGFGYGLVEVAQSDPDTGQPLSRGMLTDGKIPTISEAPCLSNITTFFAETYEPTGPFGAKGIGEAAMNPVAAAYVNAVHNAIRIRFTEIPILPEHVLAALNQKRRGDAQTLEKSKQ